MADLPRATLVYYGADLRIAVGRPGETAARPQAGSVGPGIDPGPGDSTALSSAQRSAPASATLQLPRPFPRS
jgi:hypothetical protein